MTVEPAILLFENRKKCTKCGELKPFSNFYVKRKYHKESISRYEGRCKVCHRQIRKLDYPQNKKQLRRNYEKYHQKYRPLGIKSDFYIRNKLSQLRHKSKKLNLPFNITIEDVIVPEYCPVLGIKLVFNEKQPRWNSPSVDRIIPVLGYVKGNVIVVSNLANTIKSVATIEQLKAVADFYCRLEESRKNGESS